MNVVFRKNAVVKGSGGILGRGDFVNNRGIVGVLSGAASEHQVAPGSENGRQNSDSQKLRG